MFTKILLVFSAIYIQSTFGSQNHGPTAYPEVLHNGYLADTHEVAAAKAEHLAALAKASAHGGHSGHYSHGSHSGVAYQGHHGDLRYHGPTAIPHVLHDGHIADTHEVAAAKAEHLAAVAKASAHGGHSGHYSHGSHSGVTYQGHHGDLRYHGPTAIPHVLHDGHIADTHEVAAAKAEHLAAVVKASAHGGHSGHYSHDSHSGVAYQGHHGDLRYHGPTAIPHVLHGGHIADTHEVAAAKAEHLAAVAKASAHGGHSGHYSHGSHSGVTYQGHHGDLRYHGPTAIPHVLHDGHIADTHEVAAAKHRHLHALHSALFGHHHEVY